MNFKCPICNREMQSVTKNLWLCPDRIEYLPELNSTIPINHAMYIVNETGIIEDATVISLPYKIHINYKQKKTIVYKLQKLSQRKHLILFQHKKQFGFDKIKTIHFVKIMSTNGLINLSLYDKQKILNKIKTFIVFS